MKRVKLSRFLQWRFNIFLYKSLGWEVCFHYMHFLGKLFFLMQRKDRERIVNSIQYVFDGRKGNDEIKEISRMVFKGILSHYYEKIFNAYEDINGLKGFFTKSIDARHLYKLDEALRHGKGVLFVTGHYGAIEYIPIFLALNQYPISVVAKFATKQLEDTLYSKTMDIGLKIINANKGNIINRIFNELRENRIVFIECDEIEEWRSSKKDRMWFLGKLIGIDKTMDVIKRRSGAEIIFGILHRFNLNRYCFIIESYQEILSRLGIAGATAGEVALKYLERHIYYYPEEWYQWKNYALIPSPAGTGIKDTRKIMTPFPEPAFSKA